MNNSIKEKDTKINLSKEQYKRLRADIWKSVGNKTLEMSIEDHKRKLVIFGLETIDYNCSFNNRQIYRSIISDANMQNQLPSSSTLRVDFLGRRTAPGRAKKTPAMVVTYSSEDLIFTALKLKGQLKSIKNMTGSTSRKVFPKSTRRPTSRWRRSDSPSIMSRMAPGRCTTPT